MGRCGAGAASEEPMDRSTDGAARLLRSLGQRLGQSCPRAGVMVASSKGSLVTYRSAFLQLQLPVMRPPTTAHGASEPLTVGKRCPAVKRGCPVHRMCLPQIFDPTKHPPADLGAVILQGL